MTEVDASRCPLCGKSNDCGQLLPAVTSTAAEQGCNGNADCWCFQAAIPRHLLDQIPPELRGKACICQTCASAAAAEAAALGFDASGTPSS
ncbi:cysteine-rich CWC family protein [Pseudomaricurvus sp. HS19]|uniref:cysteine-rich CWC family protein n=1 Tax=Pseudomaricurvus sp. HS19 TaxID=2692626 RepID=UPI00136F3D2D|nr:DNA or RNA helicase of superfamily II [Pseudomaricurvus sp. HS19]